MSTSNQPAAARAAINRANSQHSTGPRTPQGKARSSLNAMKHGLSAQVVVAPKEDLAAYRRFAKQYFHELRPKGVIEMQLVQNLADGGWRLNRNRGLETNLLTLGFDEQASSIIVGDPEIHCALATAKAYRAESRTLTHISMHEQRIWRQFDRNLDQLRKLQTERRKQEQAKGAISRTNEAS